MRLGSPSAVTEPYFPDAQGTSAQPDTPFLARLFRAAGPGLLVAVGYMDPGNWATDIEAGSRYGYALLFVVAACGLAAILLQYLALKLGIVAGRDLAQMSRERHPRAVRILLWLLAEAAIVACDVAEVLGSALAFKLLFGLPLWAGVLLTGLDTLLVLGFKGRGLRPVEAVVLALVLTISACFAVELLIAGPRLGDIAGGLVPKPALFADPKALYLAVGILGATVMPHNLYLHSAMVQKRGRERGGTGMRDALRFSTIDIVIALVLATVVNGAILILSAVTFHASGHTQVGEIDEAYRLLAPLTGTPAAALLFAVALLAAGQSATFTGTIAGQVILEGFLNLSVPLWMRRLVTRALALLPALAGIWWLGDGGVGKLLVFTQVVLSAQLPFAIYPLIRFTADPRIMGAHAISTGVRVIAWCLFGLIVVANVWLLTTLRG